MVEHKSAVAESSEIERPRGVRRILWGGWRGIRWASFFARPVAVIVGALSLIPTTFGFGAGYGIGFHRATVGAGGFYLACLFWGLMLGSLVAVLGLCRRPRDPNRPLPWLVRPIRLRPWRRVARPDQVADAPAQPRSVVWFRREARLTRWIVGLGLIPLVVALGLGIFINHFVSSRLAAALAAAEADDPNWQIDDLMAARRVVPDEENGAIVVAEVFDLLGGDWPPKPVPPPAPPTPLMQAFDRWPTAESAARLDDADAFRAALLEQSAAVELARTVADYRWGRHELDVQPNPLDTPLLETQNARSVARLLRVDAEVLADEGRIDAALGSVRAIFGVGRSIGDEPFLISGLVRFAISTIGRHSLRRTLALGEASPEALAAVQAVLLEDWAEPMLLTEARGERASFDALLRRVRDGELPISALGGGGDAVRAATAVGPWGQLWFDHQRAVGLEWQNEAVRIAHRPIPERPPLVRDWTATFLRTQDGNFARWGAVLPLLMMPALDAWMNADARNGAELGASVLLVAAEQHRLRHGDWPATLAAIDRDILPTPPPDPFTGQPYRMEHRGGRLSIYSMGPNGRDEHGAYNTRTYSTGGPDDFGTGAWDVALRRQSPRPREPNPTPEGSVE